MKYKKIFLIVLDSLGVGALNDANLYNDAGANTLKSICDSMDINIPNLERLGMGNIIDIKGVKKTSTPSAYYTKLDEVSVGKDTMTGHWEMMGLKITEPFQTFTDTGFPKELLDMLSEKTGRGIVGNKSASGTEILDELGEHQMKTGDLIVYTSADSVLQIAAHEEIIPIEELYKICEIAREITMCDQWKVGRVIARPYIGSGKGNFVRTSNRHDYALKPFGETILDRLKASQYDVIGVGKINDIFDGEGITEYVRASSNEDGMEKTIKLATEDKEGLIFVNLVDFDALYGHRRNPVGYGKCLESFDKQLEQLLDLVSEDDLVILTADHGNDPCFHGTDHTREFVPLLIYNKNFKNPKELPMGTSFACIGNTIAENFGIEQMPIGFSYLKDLL